MSEWIGDFEVEIKNGMGETIVAFKIQEPSTDMTKCIWAFSKKGELKSISNETVASILAEQFPETIYFVAAMVTHPDY